MPRGLLVSALAVLCAGCGVFDFEVEREVEEFTVLGDPTRAASGQRVEVDAIPPQEWGQDLEDLPAGIFMERMHIEITATAADGDDTPDTFDFIDSLVFFVDPTNEGSALGRYPLAWVYSPGAETRVELTINRALNLLPYIVEGFDVISELRARVPPDDVSFAGKAFLSVDLL